MSVKPTRPRERALRDFEDIIAYYEREAGTDTALAFTDELQRVYRSIADAPKLGSPRYGATIGIPDLRSQATRKFPYIVFYREEGDHIAIWRVLHARRDIPARFQDSAG